jgi:hypothetical protein
MIDLDFEVHYASKLEQLATIICTGPHQFDPVATHKHTVSLGLIDKALNTHQAVVLLVKHDRADDGMALLRTLVEATINAGYIFLEGDGTAERFSDFMQYRRWLDLQELAQVDKPLVVSMYSKSELREIQKRHDAVKHKYDHKHDWCPRGFGVFKRAERLDQHFEAEYRKLLTPRQFRKQIGRADYNHFRVTAPPPLAAGQCFHSWHCVRSG